MRGAVLLACVSIFIQPSLRPQDTSIRSVRVSLKAKPDAKVQVVIENLRDSPLLESTIGLFAPGEASPRVFHYSNFQNDPEGLRKEGVVAVPIASRGRRVIAVDVPDPQGQWTPALTLVTFADGYYEGTLDMLTEWRESRHKQADELAYWIRVMDAAPRDSIDAVRRHFADMSAEREAQNPGEQTELRSRVEGFRRYDGTLRSMLAAMSRERGNAAGQWTALQPSLVGPLSARPVRSATLSPNDRTPINYVVAIENAGGVPVEAWGWEYLDPRTGRGTGGETHDTCVVPPDVSRGSIAPGEVRELFSGRTLQDGPPSLAMTFVLFEDLSFEGSMSARDELFRRREGQGESFAYVIEALRRADAEPTQTVAILTAAYTERARQPKEQTRYDTAVSQLEELIRQAKASPSSFAASAASREDSLEWQRQRLLRHLTR